MSHFERQFGRRKRTAVRTQPYGRATRAELWERFQEAERRIDKATGLANDLGRDLRRAPGPSSFDYSDRAYQIRAVLRDGRSTQNQEEDP